MQLKPLFYSDLATQHLDKQIIIGLHLTIFIIESLSLFQNCRSCEKLAFRYKIYFPKFRKNSRVQFLSDRAELEGYEYY